MDIGNKIKDLRKKKGLTQMELSKMANISRSYLADVERNRYNPSIETLTAIAKALGTTIYYIMEQSVKDLITDAISDQGITLEQVSNRTGVKADFILNIDNLNSPDQRDYENIKKIAIDLKISPRRLQSALMKREAPIYDPKITNVASSDFEPVGEPFRVNMSDYINIPIVGTVRAGRPILAQDNIEGYQPISKGVLDKDKKYFYLRVQGDSMSQEFSEGSLLLIEKSPCVENGDIAVILIDDTEATVKKVIQNKNMITLIPCSNNPIYVPKMYDVIKDKISIIGKVKQATKIY